MSGWYVEVTAKIQGWRWVKRLAIGPTSWSRARDIAVAWRAEFGGPADVVDRLYPGRSVLAVEHPILTRRRPAFVSAAGR